MAIVQNPQYSIISSSHENMNWENPENGIQDDRYTHNYHNSKKHRISVFPKQGKQNEVAHIDRIEGSVGDSEDERTKHSKLKSIIRMLI